MRLLIIGLLFTIVSCGHSTKYGSLIRKTSNTQLSCIQAIVNISQRAGTKEVKSLIDKKKSGYIRDRILAIISNLKLSNQQVNKRMSALDYNYLVKAIIDLAKEYHIEFEVINDVIGVFPDGLRNIQVSGFSFEAIEEPSFIQLHELGHLYHVIYTRMTLIEALPDSVPYSIREEFLEEIEGGLNYNQYEKEVSRLSSAVHLIRKRGLTKKRYLKKLENLVNYSHQGLLEGRILFPSKKTIEGIYANMLSKAPLIVGKNMSDLFTRISLATFTYLYAFNSPFPFQPQTLEDSEGNEISIKGFRDFVNALFK